MDLSIVENLLECSICFERFDKTNRVLPCQHTFCYKCLSAVKSNFRELKCPECRTKYNGSIEDLPCNIFVIRILEQLKLNEKNADLMKSHKLKTIVSTTVFYYMFSLFTENCIIFVDTFECEPVKGN